MKRKKCSNYTTTVVLHGIYANLTGAARGP
jgi:hypothetical protein